MDRLLWRRALAVAWRWPRPWRWPARPRRSRPHDNSMPGPARGRRACGHRAVRHWPRAWARRVWPWPWPLPRPLHGHQRVSRRKCEVRTGRRAAKEDTARGRRPEDHGAPRRSAGRRRVGVQLQTAGRRQAGPGRQHHPRRSTRWPRATNDENHRWSCLHRRRNPPHRHGTPMPNAGPWMWTLRHRVCHRSWHLHRQAHDGGGWELLLQSSQLPADEVEWRPLGLVTGDAGQPQLRHLTRHRRRPARRRVRRGDRALRGAGRAEEDRLGDRILHVVAEQAGRHEVQQHLQKHHAEGVDLAALCDLPR
mmetsp:Transcript_122653/g.392683  ORF Transcript_122653/g.392683 Transcript_122653/m.392683 type:complete len:307 (+) Transcript_122653:1810-2730(+)